MKSRRQEKMENKRVSNNHRVLGFSDPSQRREGFPDYGSLMKTTKGLHADGLP